MNQHIAHIALVIRDYDEAIKFYTEKLDFKLLEDTRLSEEKRWVLVSPPGSGQCCLLLATNNPKYLISPEMISTTEFCDLTKVLSRILI
jgi:catechol 2,3-dioxygenase-like lactoylglutathione lyase family enzyme